MKCNQTASTKRVVPPKPLLDTYRYSMVNLEESADVELDSLINELCALEVQLDDAGHVAIKSNGSVNGAARSISKGASAADHRCSFTDHMDGVQEIQLRARSPDNDSAFCDTVSLLSDAGTATLKNKEESNGGSSVDSTRGSMTTPSPTQPFESVQQKIRSVKEEMERENLSEEQLNARLKSEKIKIALEKIKEANVKKLYVKIFTKDGGSKSILIDERWTIADVLFHLADKYHIVLSHNHAIVEYYPDLYMERIYEDHEHLVENILMWTRDSTNRLIFAERRDKYDLFLTPERYLLDRVNDADKRECSQRARQELIQDFFNPSPIQPAETEGVLYLKSDGKKSWKKHYFVLRSSGLYYIPKGKSKAPKDLTCLMQLDMVNVYTAVGWQKKFKAPTEFGFALKHPQIQMKTSKYIKYLCAEDAASYQRWVVNLRIVKNGQMLLQDYETFKARLSQANVVEASKPCQSSSDANIERYNRESVIVRPKSITNRRGSSVASRNTSDTVKMELHNHGGSQRVSACRASSNGRPDRSSHGAVSLQSSVSGGSFELMSSSSNSSSQRPGSGSLNADTNSVDTNSSSSCDSAERFDRHSFENAFELDGSTTGTIKRQPLKPLPSVMGIGGAKLPLTESTKQIHNAATRRKASSSSSLDSCLRRPLSDHAAAAVSAELSSSSVSSTETKNVKGGLSDDELPPPPTAICQLSRSMSSESFNEFPPPPSPSMLQDDVDLPSPAPLSYHQVQVSHPSQDVTMRRVEKTTGSSDRLKPPPPPPPKRSESTRISTRFVSDVAASSCEQVPLAPAHDAPAVANKDTFRPMVPTKPKALNNCQLSGSKSRLSTDESSFQSELQRAMQRRLQKLQNMPA